MEEQKLEEIYRLSKENNHMLHSMRRNAFWGGLLKFAFYLIVLVIAPLWLYSIYLAPLVESMQRTMSQVQGTNAKAQAQFGSFQEMLKEIQSKFSGSASSSTQ